MHEKLIGPFWCQGCGRDFQLTPGEVCWDDLFLPFAHGLCACGRCYLCVPESTTVEEADCLEEELRARCWGHDRPISTHYR